MTNISGEGVLGRTMGRLGGRGMPFVDPEADVWAEDPSAPLLPLLSLPEAQALLPLLAAVRDGGQLDREAARWLLGNLAARVPSVG